MGCPEVAGDYLFISFLISVPTEMTQMTNPIKRKVRAGEMARQGLAAKPDSLRASDCPLTPTCIPWHFFLVGLTS